MSSCLAIRIKKHAQNPALCFLAVALLLSGCSDAPRVTAADLNAAYETALRETAPPVAMIFVANSAPEQAALAALESYFATMTGQTVSNMTANVYSPDAWLYDNLIAIKGVERIRSYFAKAAGETEALSVEFLQVAPSGPDYFIRWKMTITSARLNDGEPMISYGMTQFRFDRDGRVLLHRDFWDAGTGLYEYLPGIGGLVSRTRDLLTEF